MTVVSTPQLSARPSAGSLEHPPPASAGEIEARDVGKSYGSARFAKTVIRDCSFTIASGKLTVMIGPSGCGKSTLIRLLAGFERPNSGTISIGIAGYISSALLRKVGELVTPWLHEQ